MRITIESIHFSADRKLKTLITNKIGKLEKYFDRIEEADVTLKLENSGQIKDKCVEIVMKVPGNVIFSSSTHKKFEKATEEAISSLRRQVIKHKERRRAR